MVIGRGDQLHRVIDRHAGRDGAAGRVHIESDVLPGRDALEIEQLLGEVLGRLVGHGAPEENLPLLEEFLLHEHGHGCVAVPGRGGLVLVVVLIIVGAGKRGGETGLEIVKMHRPPTLAESRGLACAQACFGVGSKPRIFGHEEARHDTIGTVRKMIEGLTPDHPDFLCHVAPFRGQKNPNPAGIATFPRGIHAPVVKVQRLSGRIVDVLNRTEFPGTVEFAGGVIRRIRRDARALGPGLIMPGLVDAHIHIESSMLPPTEFARLAVVHGTVATVSDPHEIANVLGVGGRQLHDRRGPAHALQVLLWRAFVRARHPFETAGAALPARVVARLLARREIGYLTEVMDFPGVLHRDREVMAKIAAARRLGKPVDGHAPGLRGARAAEVCGGRDHDGS